MLTRAAAVGGRVPGLGLDQTVAWLPPGRGAPQELVVRHHGFTRRPATISPRYPASVNHEPCAQLSRCPRPRRPIPARMRTSCVESSASARLGTMGSIIPYTFPTYRLNSSSRNSIFPVDGNLAASCSSVGAPSSMRPLLPLDRFPSQIFVRAPDSAPRRRGAEGEVVPRCRTTDDTRARGVAGPPSSCSPFCPVLDPGCAGFAATPG